MADKNKNGKPLRDRLLDECRAMAEHAMAKGKPIPPNVAQILEKMESKKATAIDPTNPEFSSRAAAYDALAPDETEADLMAQLADAHNSMSISVGPATPDAIMSLKEERESGGFLRFLGGVGLVRKMNLIVIVCMVLFVSLFASDQVSGDTLNENILNFDDPWKFLLNQSFLITMAALGACFYNLFEAYKYLTEGTYDSKYESIYWIRFTLGVVSGVMLAQFIYVEPSQTTSTSFMFTKPLLAFLGGFSARVVYRILTRLVDALESFVDGNAKDVLAAREKVASLELEHKLAKIQQENSNKLSADRLAAAVELIGIKEKLAQGMESHDMKAVLDNLLQKALTPSGLPPTTPNFNNTNNNSFNNLDFPVFNPNAPVTNPNLVPPPPKVETQVPPIAPDFTGFVPPPQQDFPVFDPKNNPVVPPPPANDVVLPDFPEFKDLK